MELNIQIPSFFGRLKKPVEAQLIRFNPFQITINCPTRLKPGQLIFLNMTTAQHTLREVSARAEHCEPCGPLYQTQLRFVLERPDKQPYREAISILKAMEQSLPASVKAPLHFNKI